LTLALVRDMRELREPCSADEVADFETDVLAGFVLARASAGLADSTIRNDTGHLDLIRNWFGRPLWEMQPEDADAYFGRALAGREAVDAHRAGSRAGGLLPVPGVAAQGRDLQPDRPGDRVPAGRDEPTARLGQPQLRVPPSEAEVERLFAGWREELLTCRKFAPAARNYAASRLRSGDSVSPDVDLLRYVGCFGIQALVAGTALCWPGEGDGG